MTISHIPNNSHILLSQLKGELHYAQKEAAAGRQLIAKGYGAAFSGVMDLVIGVALTCFSSFILFGIALSYAYSAGSNFDKAYSHISDGRSQLRNAESKILRLTQKIDTLTSKIIASNKPKSPPKASQIPIAEKFLTA